MDANAAVITSVAVNFVANVVSHDAGPVGMIVNEVVENLIVLAGHVICEDTVGAVVVDDIITKHVLARTKWGSAGIDGQFDSREASLVAIIFLDDVGTGTGQADAIAFTLARSIRVCEYHVAGDERLVGFVQVNPGSVVMNSISRDLHASDNEPIGIDDGPASLGARAANYEDAVETVVMNLVVGDASGSDREFAVAVVQLDTGAVIIVNEHGIDGTVIGVFNMDAVARAIGDSDMRDVQAAGEAERTKRKRRRNLRSIVFLQAGSVRMGGPAGLSTEPCRWI